MFIETHAHLYEPDYEDDIAEVITRAREAGAAKILVPPTNLESTRKAVALCRRFPDLCHSMVGLHPEDVKDGFEAELDQLESLLEADRRSDHPQFVAIGEVGLDYYWDKTHKEEQRQAFGRQIEWASRHRLPLMIHSRSANGDLLACLRPWRDKLEGGGVFHCFTGSLEEARELLRFHPRFYLGIGGVLTFRKSRLPEVLSQLPLDRLVLETDSPYMAPVPMRGKRNEPSFIPYIVQVMAQALGTTADEVERQTTLNARSLFFS